jgi:hypothetical protein
MRDKFRQKKISMRWGEGEDKLRQGPQGQVLVLQVPNLSGRQRAWPITTYNRAPIIPKPDPVGLVEVRSPIIFKMYFCV